MDAIKGLFKVYEVNVQLSLPFCALFDDVLQSKYLVCAPFSWSKTGLLLSELLVHCLFNSLDDDFCEGLAWNRQEGYSSPVVTVAQGSLNFSGSLL